MISVPINLKFLKLCLAVKKENVIKLQLTKGKSVLEKTDTRKNSVIW
jgi:hypothetical protein